MTKQTFANGWHERKYECFAELLQNHSEFMTKTTYFRQWKPFQTFPDSGLIFFSIHEVRFCFYIELRIPVFDQNREPVRSPSANIPYIFRVSVFSFWQFPIICQCNIFDNFFTPLDKSWCQWILFLSRTFWLVCFCEDTTAVQGSGSVVLEDVLTVIFILSLEPLIAHLESSVS